MEEMNMKKLLCLLVVSTTLLAGCGNNGFTDKKVDGSFVVATVEGKDGNEYTANYFADDLLNDILKTNSGRLKVYDRLKREVIKAGFIADEENFGQAHYDEIMEDASIKKDSLIKEYKDTHKSDYKTELDKLVRSVGAKNLDDYVEYYLIHDTVLEELNKVYKQDWVKVDDFDEDNPSYKMSSLQRETLAAYIANYNPLDVEHILVSTGTNSITQSQASNLIEVIDKLTDTNVEKDFSFANIAGNLSDDAGSKAHDGKLGMMHIATPFVNEFKYPLYAWMNGETLNSPIEGSLNTTAGEIEWAGDENFSRADTWALETAEDGVFANATLGDLKSKIADTNERNALFSGLFADANFGWLLPADTFADNTNINTDLLLTKSEHGIHFINVRNITEYNSDDIVVKQDYWLSKVDAWLLDDASATEMYFNANTLITEYWNKYQTDFYWNLFVNGKIDNVNVSTGGYIGDKIQFTGTLKNDLNTYFNLSRESAWKNDYKNFIDGIHTWEKTLISSNFYYGYNSKTFDTDSETEGVQLEYDKPSWLNTANAEAWNVGSRITGGGN